MTTNLVYQSEKISATLSCGALGGGGFGGFAYLAGNARGSLWEGAVAKGD